ncbi:hypothetical protein Tco_1111593 [Tanacetum coccineum]|uniref:Uncharacterized protein n=1 Tax=Tanacetum coccineum TaxID=301880 RepID=A0ABQ5INI4_9ASTR
MNIQDTKIQEQLREMKIMMHEIQQIKLINVLKDCQPKIDEDTYTPKPLTQRSNVICYDDDDDEESTSQLPSSIAITTSLLVLPSVKPEDSLLIGDENFSTIPEKESDELIKSSVEDLVLISSESKDTSDNDSECDLPFCDDLPPLNILGGNSVTFSNPLSDSNDDFTFSNDESLLEEDDIDRKNSLLAIDELFLLDTPPPGSKLVNLEGVENFDPSLSLIRSGMMIRVADIPSLELNEDECFDPGGGEIDADIPLDF